jgi:predicted DNA-binding protein
MKTLSIRVPDDLDERLGREARIRGRRRSEVARDALDHFLDESERERFLKEVVEDARKLYADESARREALEIAEEFLPLENEALEIAEGSDSSDEDPWWE